MEGFDRLLDKMRERRITPRIHYELMAIRVLKVAAGIVEIAINASADPGGERGAKAAGLLYLRQLDAQAADVRQHLHPDVGVRRAAGDAQGLHVGKAFAHAVEVGHVAEHHAFVDGLQ